MKKTDMIESERPTRTVHLNQAQGEEIRRKARADHEENGTDGHTRDPDNIMSGRIRGVGAELAFVQYARDRFGPDAVDWIAGEDGESEPYDVTVNGVNVDVQARNDENDYDSYAILKEKRLADRKSDVDVYVCMVTDNSASRFVLWGYCERDRLHNPQQIDRFRFSSDTYFMDDKSPYFKDANELERRLKV